MYCMYVCMYYEVIAGSLEETTREMEENISLLLLCVQLGLFGSEKVLKI